MPIGALAKAWISEKLGADTVSAIMCADSEVPLQWPQSLRDKLVLDRLQGDKEARLQTKHLHWIRRCFKEPQNKSSHDLTYIGPPTGECGSSVFR